ncbi:hypothetical protein Csa_017346 [Cucumis sativus]|nr:hypothetical protein Csa_017346 [Cucumis sativus]
MESVCVRVVMISWPFFIERQSNFCYCSTEQVIAIEIDNDEKRNEIEELVRELMDGENGKEMEKNVMLLKSKEEEACKFDGFVCQQLNKLMAEISVKKQR